MLQVLYANHNKPRPPDEIIRTDRIFYVLNPDKNLANTQVCSYWFQLHREAYLSCCSWIFRLIYILSTTTTMLPLHFLLYLPLYHSSLPLPTPNP